MSGNCCLNEACDAHGRILGAILGARDIVLRTGEVDCCARCGKPLGTAEEEPVKNPLVCATCGVPLSAGGLCVNEKCALGRHVAERGRRSPELSPSEQFKYLAVALNFEAVRAARGNSPEDKRVRQAALEALAAVHDWVAKNQHSERELRAIARRLRHQIGMNLGDDMARVLYAESAWIEEERM